MLPSVVLLSIFAIGIFMMKRKYIKMKDIRVEMPTALCDIFQAPTNDQIGSKSEILRRHEVSSNVSNIIAYFYITRLNNHFIAFEYSQWTMEIPWFQCQI